MKLEHLPIASVIPQLQKALSEHSIVLLTAEPGAGKTTQVPLVLQNEIWLGAKKIIMLEPRRLAARAAEKKIVVRVALFDVYKGQGVPQVKKSLAKLRKTLDDFLNPFVIFAHYRAGAHDLSSSSTIWILT